MKGRQGENTQLWISTKSSHFTVSLIANDATQSVRDTAVGAVGTGGGARRGASLSGPKGDHHRPVNITCSWGGGPARSKSVITCYKKNNPTNAQKYETIYNECMFRKKKYLGLREGGRGGGVKT